MERKRTVLIADANEVFRVALMEALRNEEDLEVVGTTCDGLEAVRLLRKLEPDVLITDLVLEAADGFEVLKALKGSPTQALVLSAFVRGSIAEEVAAWGGSYYMVKPCRLAAVVERTRLLANLPWSEAAEEAAAVPDRPALAARATEILREIGVPAHVRGYHYVREAILMAVEDKEVVSAVTKILYPAIAGKFDTAPTRVERAIRNALEVAWNRGSREALRKYVGGVASAEGRPKSSEFIASVADYLALSCRQG